MISIRRYRPGEELELRRLFHDTVRNVCSADYTPEQVQAWAPDEYDEQAWQDRIAQNNPYVCIEGERIVGFADLQSSGYIDHFFVQYDRQGCGIGSRLMSVIEAEAAERGIHELTANVSITAEPFFAARGFEVVAPQEVSIGAVVFRNFRMKKRLEEL